jgi:hypothetical protein
MSFQEEPKARRVLGRWLGVSEAHIRSDLTARRERAQPSLGQQYRRTWEVKRVNNNASGPKNKRIKLVLKAHWN